MLAVRRAVGKPIDHDKCRSDSEIHEAGVPSEAAEAGRYLTNPNSAKNASASCPT